MNCFKPSQRRPANPSRPGPRQTAVAAATRSQAGWTLPSGCRPAAWLSRERTNPAATGAQSISWRTALLIRRTARTAKCRSCKNQAGKLSATCMHNSCNGRGWKEFRDAIGKPDADHYDPPYVNNRSQSPRHDSRDDALIFWEPNIVAMSSIQPRAVQWLWKNRIPNGKLVSLSGNPGLGKTLVLIDIAARVSTGAAWPDGCPGSEPGGVVICSAEDDPHDTLRPRFDSAGADVRPNQSSGIGSAVGRQD